MANTTIRRVVGDLGAKARITLNNLTDTNGTPVTIGTVTLRADNLFVGTMTHTGDGTWIYDPAEGDLSRSGIFLLEALLVHTGQQTTIPSDGTWTLNIRDPAAAPPA